MYENFPCPFMLEGRTHNMQKNQIPLIPALFAPVSLLLAQVFAPAQPDLAAIFPQGAAFPLQALAAYFRPTLYAPE